MNPAILSEKKVKQEYLDEETEMKDTKFKSFATLTEIAIRL